MIQFGRAKNSNLSIILFSGLVLSACSHTSEQRVSTINSSAKTPTQSLNEYALESQKRELDQVIGEEVVEEKPAFLLKVDNKKVDFWVKYFAIKEKARFERFLNNGAKYRSIIEKTFDDYGLPKELFYVGLIESGYYLGAKSHAGAVGPWQFIRDTGKRYGLTIRSGIDERRSIVKSTQAAALYFQDLYNIFGNWELALSAYNAGEYGIVRRIRKAKTRDYYELSAQRALPKETIHYVPKVLAAMKIMENPKKYNLRVPNAKADIYENTTEVTLKNSVKIDLLAKKTGVSKSLILKLNPDLYWRTVPYVKNGYTLYLPNKNFSPKVLEEINHSKRRVASSSTSGSSTYSVKRGDNLISIARHYNVNLSELKRQNNIKRSNHIRIGQKLKIPSGAQEIAVYKVKRGDNLYELARRNHTSISKILKLNNLKRRTIYVGQKLKLPQVDKSFYTVRPGDYLLKIAKRHGISVKKLKKLNSISRSKIYPGQKLVVDVN